MKTPSVVRIVLSVLLFTGFISCSDDNSKIVEADNTFRGRYKIASIRSDRGIDMNNDGLESQELFQEMCSSPNVTIVLTPSCFDYSSPDNHAEVGPQPNSNPGTTFIDFGYPYQIFPYEEEDDYSTVTYLRRFINYSYKYDPERKIKIIDKNPDFNSQYGKVNSLTRINENVFKIDLTINIYNFKNKAWAKENVEVTYQKVEWYEE